MGQEKSRIQAHIGRIGTGSGNAGAPTPALFAPRRQITPKIEAPCLGFALDSPLRLAQRGEAGPEAVAEVEDNGVMVRHRFRIGKLQRSFGMVQS